MKKTIRFFSLLGLVAILFAVSATPAFAMDEPDSVSLYDITIYGNLIVTGDLLAIVPYDIPFTTTPDDALSETFLFRMLSPDGSETIGSKLAYPYQEDGYGTGIVSFYIQSGTTWDEAYIFRVDENPAFYADPQHWDFTVGPSNYTSLAFDHADILRADIIDIATILSNDYNQELLTTNEGAVTLSTYGEIYFLNAVPGLAVMCPELLSLQLRSPTYTERSWDHTVADALTTKYSGTFIGDFMTGYAGLFSLNTNNAMNSLSIFLFVAMILISTWKFKGTTLSGFMDGYALLICLMLNGFFSMILTGFIAFIVATVGGVILFLNRA